MTSLASYERTALCALAQQLGPDAPTLCGDWTVRDLVVHLLVREGHPAVIGMFVPPLSGLVDRVSARVARRDFDDLVDTLRHGPPLYSPLALPVVGDTVNALEFFVHHEDIRRAQEGWVPRELPAKAQDAVWKAVRHAGRGLVMKSGVGVKVGAQRVDTGDQVTLRPGSDEVVVVGEPAEITMFLFGRDEALVELRGDPAGVAALRGARLGL